MNRRNFIWGTISAGLLAGGVPAARAQPQDVPAIGFLEGPWSGPLAAEVRHGLRDNGFATRRVREEFSRWSKFDVDQIARNTEDLIRRQIAVILAFSNKAALAAATVTKTIPIVFLGDNPLQVGLVDRLDRPGGNLTGVATSVSDLIARRIEIARALVPVTDLVALVSDPSNLPAHDIEVREAQAAAKAFGLQLSEIAWSGEHKIEVGLAALPRDRKVALVFGTGLPVFVGGAQLAYLATRYGFFAILADRAAAVEGALVSFGPRFADAGYLMGAYAARILNGDAPADLPVKQITKTELVINLWVAKSAGLQIPSTLLACADEVIE